MSKRKPAKIVYLHDICIDCDGSRVYPSGAPCKSCGGTGRVNRGDGIPPCPRCDDPACINGCQRPGAATSRDR